MSAPLVTVLIDTYNYGRFIEDAIESVLSQDFPLDQVEILIVDDGSTDDTMGRVKKFGSRIEYFYKPNGGQASAFNFGIAMARGEIVAFLDADDYWLPGKLRRIATEFERNPETGMIYHRLLELDAETGKTGESPFVLLSGYLPNKISDLLQYFPYPTSCIAFRRRFLDRVLPVPEELRVQADGYLGATMAFVAPVLGISDCLATYRIHGQNLYYADEQEMAAEVRKSRLQMRRILYEGIRKWLADNSFTLKQPAVRCFLNRWTLYQESEEFLINPPGRLRFFSHLMLYNRCYRPQLSSRLRLINYVNALGSLLTGYKHFHLLEKWRLRATESFRPGSKPST
jgi:glycosyltransferase involved in cell wall biosynthesis